MAVESGERRLASLLNEVLEHSSDESSSSEVPDHCSDHERESDTQEIIIDHADSSSEWDSDDNIPLSAVSTRRSSANIHAPHYTSKDGQRWYKQSPRTNIRTRAENIIDEQPGVKGIAKDAKTETECWNIFFTEEMKNKRRRGDQKNIPVYIRQRISSQMNEPLRPVVQNVPGSYARCVDCSRKKDRKTKYTCTSCGKAICLEHAIFSCKNCTDFDPNC